ncbi:MAG: nucleotide-binding protein [Gammaproteobacteria bacterium]|nr:nucleotide-binding protein [Gammaproteobacteria bacterium]MBU2058189.1 nucleotide-binding protein [Gammaproteobacteria bacterium]MBU2176924.1 nucleotide-binding protein [Gammaproteobacteria bacterium]MBU2246035.1 nucleotide-binding protein [Gammaproteobacteria bacterium]MBU2344106.1 nucleotide-binding protein [Gammaproteobacteria bacterium]
MDSKISILDRLIIEGEKFSFDNFCYKDSAYPGEFAGTDKAEWLEWKTRVKNIVCSFMPDQSSAVRLAVVASGVVTKGYGPDNFHRAKSTFLTSLKNTKSVLIEDVYGELKLEESENVSPLLSNKIFVVHGHDSDFKNDVERFIHEIGLEPIVLHRQADEGNTIIEKFEKNSDVGYAFILLSPDEIAYTVSQSELPEKSREIEYRARPNVIFEFGYFVGKLGRSKVCCLHKGNVSIPSDLSGIVYKKVEASIDSQAYAIIKDLKAAGYKIKV